MNARKLHQSTINFALKSEFICPILFTSSALIIEIVSSRPLLRSQVYFGSIQPIYFIRELGFVEGENSRLKFDKNSINFDSKNAVNFRLRFTPYKKINFQVKINVFEILLPETAILVNLNNELFLGNL